MYYLCKKLHHKSQLQKIINIACLKLLDIFSIQVQTPEDCLAKDASTEAIYSAKKKVQKLSY